MRVVGVDGLLTPRGWVAVALRDGQLHFIHLVKDLDALVAEQRDAAVIAVNLPIGHDDSDGAVRGGVRAADLAALEYLGETPARVDPVPPLDVIAINDFDAARAEAESRGWPVPSEAHWRARGRIHSLQAVAAGPPPFVEVHPEVSFTALLRELKGPAACLAHAPRSLAGQYERLSLLHVAGLRPMRSFGGVGRASPEDVLAATAAAWSAHRVATGHALTLPDSVPEGTPRLRA